MFRMTIIAAALAALATAASARPSPIYIETGTSAHVRYADLNLHSSAGRSTLVGRIRLAAGMLCNDRTEFDPFNSARNKCYRIAVASGVSQMNAIAARQAG
jgi:UrcA family protein